MLSASLGARYRDVVRNESVPGRCEDLMMLADFVVSEALQERGLVDVLGPIVSDTSDHGTRGFFRWC